MADPVVTDSTTADSADTGSSVDQLSDADWEADSWGDGTDYNGESGQAKFDREMEELLAGDDEEDDVERGDATQRVDKAKDDVQEIAAKATKRKAPDKEPAKVEAPSTYKVKLSGEEREIDAAKLARAIGVSEKTLSMMEPGAAEKVYQKVWFGEQQQREGAQALKQFQEFIANVEGDTATAVEIALQQRGISKSFKDICTEYLARQYEMQSMPPEQRELYAAKQQLERIKRQQAEAEAQAQAEREQAQRVQWAANLKAEISGALEGAKIPTETRMMRRVVDLMQRERQELAEGEAPTPVRDLIPRLEQEMDADLSLRFSTLGAAGFVQRFPEIAKAIGQYQLAEARKRSNSGQFQPADPVQAVPRGKPKREKVSDLPWMKPGGR